MKPDLRIGISGWIYGPWRGVFYPPKLPQARELEFASREVNTIEINGSFYSLKHPKDYLKWYSATPDDFRFAVKGGRFITHIKRLKEVEAPLANFFASGVLHLREKLGPFLWQLPPNFKFDPERIERFLSMLPRNMDEASRLAEQHDVKVSDRSYVGEGGRQKLRHALEVRHESFHDERFVAFLRKYGVALVFSDSPGDWPYFEDVTTDFVYLRLHGHKELYSGGYDAPALDEWARRIRLWSKGGQPAQGPRISSAGPRREARDCYIYFDNDAKVRAPFDAVSLLERLTDFRPAIPLNREALRAKAG